MSDRKHIQSEARLATNIRQDQLWCGDCVFKNETRRAGDISSCLQYPEKPNRVLCGGECLAYKKQRM